MHLLPTCRLFLFQPIVSIWGYMFFFFKRREHPWLLHRLMQAMSEDIWLDSNNQLKFAVLFYSKVSSQSLRWKRCTTGSTLRFSVLSGVRKTSCSSGFRWKSTWVSTRSCHHPGAFNSSLFLSTSFRVIIVPARLHQIHKQRMSHLECNFQDRREYKEIKLQITCPIRWFIS